MAVGLRKLLNVSASGDNSLNATDLCQSYCDASYYQVQACPQTCIYLCPSICSFTPVPAAAPSPLETDYTGIPAYPDIPGVKPINPKVFLSISLSVLAAAFVLFSFLAGLKFCSIWFNRRQRRPRRSNARLDPNQFVDYDEENVVDHPIWYIRTVGLQQSIINGIAVTKYSKGNALIDGTVCAICLSEFKDDESLRLLPKCNHPFHLPCIDTWLRSHTNCPICRSGIMANSSRLPSTETSDEGENNRESEMGTENEHSEQRNNLHDHTISMISDEKMNENVVGRSLSMDCSYRIQVAERGELSERWVAVMETGGASSSSSSSCSIKKSASCSGKVFPSR